MRAVCYRFFSALSTLVALAGCGPTPNPTFLPATASTGSPTVQSASDLKFSATVVPPSDGSIVSSGAVPPSPVSDGQISAASLGPAAESRGLVPKYPDALAWSDISTWGGSKPTSGSSVNIPFGKVVVLDESPPNLKSLTVDGTLLVKDRAKLSLTAGYIVVRGAFLIGTVDYPFDGQFEVTLNASDIAESPIGMGTRGLFNSGGRVEIYARTPRTIWTKLSDDASKSTNNLSVLNAADWQSGDELVVAPTDFFGIQSTWTTKLQSNADGQLKVTDPLPDSRWGKLQYLTSSGMALSQPAIPVKTPLPGTPTVLDQRAALGNLTRNVVIQGADDSLWRSQGFGGQLMVMGAMSSTIVQGVQFRRVGQSGIKGRYPIHFHQLSYTSAGLEMPSAGNRIVIGSTISQSSNRCITLHGTNEVTLEKNICHDIAGHAIFFEDAVERKNRIISNLVLKVRASKTPLLASENWEFGASGLWITHPDNVVTGNHLADCDGHGIWYAIPSKPLGLNKLVKNVPSNTVFGRFFQNTVHTNRQSGINFDNAPVDDAGNVVPIQYAPTVDGLPPGPTNRARFVLAEIATWKNNGSGFWNRVGAADFERWVSADNIGVFFAGATLDVRLTQSLAVGTSLNAATTWATVNSDYPPNAFASYHSTADLIANVAVNFKAILGKQSGVFNTFDYYTDAIEKGLVRNVDNLLINSDPGILAQPYQRSFVTQSAALWDANGYWGPKGNYWVPDLPFLTTGANCIPVLPTGNGMSCSDKFYGVGGFIVDGSDQYVQPMPLTVKRLDRNGQLVATHHVGPTANDSTMGGFRFFGAVKAGQYVIDYRGLIPKFDSSVSVSNAFRADDYVMLAIPFDGTAQIGAQTLSRSTVSQMQSVSSLAEVQQSQGRVFWQDRTNNLVWVKAVTPNPSLETADLSRTADLYQSFSVKVFAR